MSSVTRFLKQHDASQTYLSAPAFATLYDFVLTVPGSTGNYPDGYVQLASANTALAAAFANITNTGVGFIMRDMGKTIKARLTNTSGVYGYFRQVQVLAPKGLSATGTNVPVSASIGVIGEAAQNYFILYIPVPLAGILSVTPVPGVSILAGGEF